MRRTILLPILALIGGLGLGTLLGSGIFSASHALTSGGTTTVALTESSRAAELLPTATPLDTGDNSYLLERSESVLEDLKEADYSSLAALVHPEKGLTLTPFSTVSFEYDRTLTREQVAALLQDREVYTWGVMDGSGTPIRSTCADYFARFVYNADYTQAPEIGVDTVLMSGNALENVAEAYPEARFVDYNFPGIDPVNSGYDWCSLKLVFEVWQNNWYLVGLIHSEWTI